MKLPKLLDGVSFCTCSTPKEAWQMDDTIEWGEEIEEKVKK